MADYACTIRGYRGQLCVDADGRCTWENIRNVILLIEDADRIKIVSHCLRAEKARAYLWRRRPDLGPAWFERRITASETGFWSSRPWCCSAGEICAGSCRSEEISIAAAFDTAAPGNVLGNDSRQDDDVGRPDHRPGPTGELAFWAALHQPGQVAESETGVWVGAERLVLFTRVPRARLPEHPGAAGVGPSSSTSSHSRTPTS